MVASTSEAIEQAALAYLRKYGPQTCANLGAALWGDRLVAGNCSCPWARPAGAVLHRLKARGLVARYSDGHHTLWTATAAR
jgi:hypothetical protein